LLISIKALNGGLFVALFAVLGEILQPKRFAGVFGASPAISLGNLLVIGLVKGEATARSAGTGMIIGAVAMAVACAVAIPAVRRWGAVWGSAVLWGVWLVVGGATAVVVLGGVAAARAGTGLPVGRPVHDQQDTTGTAGNSRGRLFAVDLRSLREIGPAALVLRFAFGAALSVVAGLTGVVAGQRAGGVMLAAPAILPATLTIIERHEGRGPAVTEVQGAVLGAIALIGFAVVAAVTTTKLPLAAALLGALATWVVAAIGGYLVQAAVLPSWHRDVRDLAWQRRDAAQARRREVGPPKSRPQPDEEAAGGGGALCACR
jgi:hypothetical protein